MILLLDTHILLRAAYDPPGLSQDARSIIEDHSNTLVFSAASIWEVAIKSSLGRKDFLADARVLRRALLEAGYQELPLDGAHTAAVADLPALHKDPFDRILLAQARHEGITLLTSDQTVAAYGQPTRYIQTPGWSDGVATVGA